MPRKNETAQRQALSDLLTLQATFEQNKGLVRDLKEKIQEKTEELAALKKRPTVLPALLEKKEDMLALLEIGQGNQEELESLEQEILAESKALEELTAGATGPIANVEALLNGLQRKVDEMEKSQYFLEQSVVQATADFLKEEAERIGEEYATLAHALADKFRQIMALGRMFDKYRFHMPPLSSGLEFNLLSIPTFRLECHKPGSPRYQGEFPEVFEGIRFVRDQYPRYFAEDIESETERIKALGVKL
jgi:chromosome segregation ATPase